MPRCRTGPVSVEAVVLVELQLGIERGGIRRFVDTEIGSAVAVFADTVSSVQCILIKHEASAASQSELASEKIAILELIVGISEKYTWLKLSSPSAQTAA